MNTLADLLSRMTDAERAEFDALCAELATTDSRERMAEIQARLRELGN